MSPSQVDRQEMDIEKKPVTEKLVKDQWEEKFQSHGSLQAYKTTADYLEDAPPMTDFQTNVSAWSIYHEEFSNNFKRGP